MLVFEGGGSLATSPPPTLEYEHTEPVFEGGCSLATSPPPLPSKTSHVCSFLRVEALWQHHHHPPSRTSHVCSFSRVEALWQHHHSFHPKNEPPTLVLEGGC